MTEVYGRRGGGDGVLHTYIRELSMLPIVDPRSFSQTEAEDFIALFEEVASRPALPIAEELRQADRQAFDAWAMQRIFGDDAADASQAIASSLIALSEERFQRAQSGREQERKAVKRSTFDPAPVAARIIMDIGVPPEILHLFGKVDPKALTTTTIQVPAHQPGKPEAGSTLLDQDQVLIDGEPLMATPSDAHALVMMAALTTNRDLVGDVALPDEVKLVEEKYRKWVEQWKNWRGAIFEALASAFPRPQQAQRKEQVRREVESQLKLSPGVLRP